MIPVITDAKVQVAGIRTTMKKLLGQNHAYFPANHGVNPDTALSILQDVYSHLSYLGLSHWVGVGEFQDAARRLKFNRDTGSAVYAMVESK
ncbi:hypothetical protein BV898_03003 [Hypsibius exemplaris]|uniref:Uncharacterized protein n=1 Tax=Hypsibius exemplaris TaxID=2072580 RepID=A0A1W0X6P2_HYPEX|nr:hypothetical protein BV898_03003 [Hypsibius exemplaris]